MNKHNRSLGDNSSSMPSPSTIYNHRQPFSQYESQSVNTSQPCKSPSPDKKRANIITPTKSPQLIEIKRNMTPLRLSQKKFEKTPIELKPSMRSSNMKNYNQQSTKYYTNEDFQQYRSSQRKNEVLQQLQNMMPQQFMLGNTNTSQMMMSQYRSVQPQMSSSSLTKELDYIKLLQQKQRTIKQLHQIIQMINRNNSLDLSASCGDANVLFQAKNMGNDKNKKIFQTTHGGSDAQKLLMLSASKIQSPQQIRQKNQLKQQIKTLTIQNQQLIHMIQKMKNSQKGDKQMNIKKYQSYTQWRLKQEKLTRQLNQMKQNLQIKQSQNKQLQYENREIINRCTLLDLQNQKLIKMMKQKQLSDRKYHASLIESTLSMNRSPINQSQITQQQTNNYNTNNPLSINSTNKQRLSLVKIKEQYNQSLKVFKDTICGDVQQFMAEMGRSVKAMQDKLIQMQQQVKTLQKFKTAYQVLKQKKIDITSPQNVKPSLKYKQQQKLEQQIKSQQMRRTDTIINQIEQLSQIQMTSPQKMVHSSPIKKGEQQIKDNEQIQSLIKGGRKGHLYQQIHKELQIERRLNDEYEQKMAVFKQRFVVLEQRCHQLQTEKNKLQQKCHNIQQRATQLQRQNGQLQRQIGQLQRQNGQIQQVRLKLQMRDSRNRRNQQIQDINIARAQQKQIQTLRDMIKKYQKQLDQEKSLLLQEIQMFKIKQKQFYSIIEHNQKQFYQKQQKFTLQLRQKQRLIQSLKEQNYQKITQLSQKQQKINQLSQNQQKITQLSQKLQHYQKTTQELQRKLAQHQQTTQLKLSQSQQQLKQKQQLLNQLKQTLTIKQYNQTHTHQQIQKLIQNYEKQINILKQNIISQEQKHYDQIEEKNVQIRRLIIEGQNVEKLMHDMEQNYTKQIEQMKTKMVRIQEQMKSKMVKLQDQMSRKMIQQQKGKRQYQQLLSQQQQMKQTIDRLLSVAKQVEEIQQQNKQLHKSINEEKQSKQNLLQTIKDKQQLTQKYCKQIQTYNKKIQTYNKQKQTHNKQIQTLNSNIKQLQMALIKSRQQLHGLRLQIEQRQLVTNRVRKQSQQQITQREYDLAREENKHQLEKLQYQTQIQNFTIQIDTLINQKLQLTLQLDRLRQIYLQLITIKEDHKIIDQLYQLKTFLNTNLNKLFSQSSQMYDFNKILIDYQSKCDQIITLTNRLQQNNSSIINLHQQKSLLQEKVNYLSKNINIYQNQLKQRKLFTDKLLLDKTKLQKEIALIKKGHIQTHKQQTQTLKTNLIDLVNNILKIQSTKDQKINYLINNTQSSNSPIRRVTGLISDDKSKQNQSNQKQIQEDTQIYPFQLKQVKTHHKNDQHDSHYQPQTQIQQHYSQLPSQQ